MSVTIRSAAAADMEAMGILGAALVELHHDLDPERFLPATGGTAGGYADFLRREARAPEAVLLVAEEEGEIVGYAYGRLDGPDYMKLRGPAGLIHDLLVQPSCRGRGLGRLLLEAIGAELLSRGAPRLVLSTAARNDAAQRLFAAAGFRPAMVEMTREDGRVG